MQRKTTQHLLIILAVGLVISTLVAPSWAVSSGPGPLEEARQSSSGRDLPSSFDWRDLGGLTPVKDQTPCNGCWCFAALGTLESALLRHTGVEYDLSEQEIISCVMPGHGCNGGYPTIAWDHIQRHGVRTEACVPYQASHDVPCDDGDCGIVATCGGWVEVPSFLDDIKAAVMLGPVTSSFRVYPDFYEYTDGCYEHPGQDWPDHEVLIVGWDDQRCDGAGAWLCRNSFGPDWGDLGGYFWARYGTCSIGTGCQRMIYDAADRLVHHRHQILDSQGDQDGWADRGETVTLSVTLHNQLLASSRTGVTAHLASLSPWATVVEPVDTFGDLEPGQQAAGAAGFRVRVADNAPDGAIAELVLDLGAAGRDTFDLDLGPVRLLLVDDDGVASHEAWAAEALDRLGYRYHRWSVRLQGPAGAELLQRYQTVVYHVGSMGTISPWDGGVEQQALRDYLDTGGRLLVYGNDVVSSLWESGDAASRQFCRDYLRCTYQGRVSVDPTLFVSGAAGDPVSDGLALTLNGPDSATDQQMIEQIQPEPGSVGVFTHAPGCEVAVRHVGNFRLVLLAFGLEGVSGQAEQTELMRRCLTWLNDGSPTSAPLPESHGALLRGVRPNPFNARAEIALRLPLPGSVSVRVHDARGRQVCSLQEGHLAAGEQTLVWDGRDDRGEPVASGLYLVQLISGTHRESAKLAVIK